MKLILSLLFILSNIISIAQIITIPDANFKNYLINNTAINTNADNDIQLSEANSFTGTIDCFNLSINELTGIEHFTNLTQLKFSNNQVSSVDVSSNTKLLLLYCDNNQLSQLDLSSNTDLYNLICESNSLTSLDLSNNLNLGRLKCSSNNIGSLNLSTNVNLTEILCHTNSLIYLNIANGNNASIPWIDFNAQWNPNLTCVQVDDTAYSNLNWTNRISPQCAYSLNCTQTNSILTTNSDQNISTFPNPATTTLTLNSHYNIKSKVQIYSSLGILIREIQMDKSKIINIEELKNGIYFIKLESQNKFIGKFMVLR